MCEVDGVVGGNGNRFFEGEVVKFGVSNFRFFVGVSSDVISTSS